MTLWEILKANKTGIAPDMFTMLAASKMNGGRDRLHELSGIPPLSFTAKGKPLTAWSITGNTVQNGTPTPENPVEVLGCGERTANLFDIKKATFGKFMAENREVVSSSGVHSDYIDVSPNETYWISNFISQPRFYTGCEYNANKEFIRYIDLPRNAVSGTITTSEECKYIVLNTNNSISDNSFIAKSSTEIPYEPYGYKIPVVTSADGTEPITTPIYLPTPLYSGEVMRSDGTITRSDGTTETFTAPQIPTINGTTVIDVDTAVKPESMTIKYRR